MHIYIQYALMFLLGQVVHLLSVTIPSLKSKSSANNHTFDLSSWWKEDWNIIVATNALGIMAMVGLDELLNWKPDVAEYIRWGFALLGFCGSAITMRLSKYEKKIMAFLDIKANIADASVGKTKSKADLIEKGTELTGVDVTNSPTLYGNKSNNA